MIRPWVRTEIVQLPLRVARQIGQRVKLEVRLGDGTQSAWTNHICLAVASQGCAGNMATGCRLCGGGIINGNGPGRGSEES